MREIRSSGSVRGVRSNPYPYATGIRGEKRAQGGGEQKLHNEGLGIFDFVLL